jgi:hypothetical protein
MRVVLEYINYRFYRKYICIKRATVLVAYGSFGSGIGRALPLFREILPCLRLPGTDIGRNGGTPSDGDFAGGFRDKAIRVKFPHFGLTYNAKLIIC